MPVPRATGDFDSFMERCMGWAKDEHPEWDQDQRVAVCISTAREAGLSGTPAARSKEEKEAVAQYSQREVTEIDPEDDPSIAGRGGAGRKPLKAEDLEKVVEPTAGESQQEFVSRCMSAEAENFPDREQRAAVCFNKWRAKSAEAEKARVVAPLVKELTKVVQRLHKVVVGKARREQE